MKRPSLPERPAATNASGRAICESRQRLSNADLLTRDRAAGDQLSMLSHHRRRSRFVVVERIAAQAVGKINKAVMRSAHVRGAASETS